jgi:hypothetical protein
VTVVKVWMVFLLVNRLLYFRDRGASDLVSEPIDMIDSRAGVGSTHVPS